MKKLFNVPGTKFKVQRSQVEDLEPAGGDLEPGTRNIEHAAAPWAAAVLLVAVAGAPSVMPAKAQGLTDPTRPPADLAVKAPVIEGAASPVPRLQSVIISPTRKAAMINGVVVELGGKYGDAVLAKVSEDEVVLRSSTSQEVLRLYPSVEKTHPGRGTIKKKSVGPSAKTAVNPGANPGEKTGKGAR